MVIIVMGTTGAGKTTVGTLLASELGWSFADADDFHSPANLDKMRRGIPLDDADREPWLKALHSAITDWIRDGRNVVLACSALKRAYRSQLNVEPGVLFVYLKGSFEEIQQRLDSREGHFADAGLLPSQLAILEEPQSDEPAITVDLAQTPEAIVAEIRSASALSG